VPVKVLTTPAARHFGVEGLQPVQGRGLGMRARMTVDARHVGPDGSTAAGALGVAVDEALGYAIMASLPPGSWSVSTEIWVDLLAALPRTGALLVEAQTLVPGSYAAGRVRSADGQLVAECRERGRRIDRVPDVDALAEAPAPRDPAAGGLAGHLGLELHEAPRLPVWAALQNPLGVLHGGVSLAACEVLATWSRVRAGSQLRTCSLHVVHTRPAPCGATVDLAVRTVHAGRTLWLSDVTGTVAGRAVVTARVTAQ
jgi:acyl-coenzyme A thioesterase PaaI-like protein